jgi:hypothetical protein
MDIIISIRLLENHRQIFVQNVIYRYDYLPLTIILTRPKYLVFTTEMTKFEKHICFNLIKKSDHPYKIEISSNNLHHVMYAN